MVAAQGRDALLSRLGIGSFEATRDGAIVRADELARAALPDLDPRHGTPAWLAEIATRIALGSDAHEVDVEGPRSPVRVMAQRTARADGSYAIEGIVLAGPLVGDARFRYVYEKSPVAMHSIDEDGRLCDVNSEWLDLMGYAPEEVLGRPVQMLMTPESSQRARDEVIPRFWREGSVRRVPYEFVRKDGRRVEVEVDCDAIETPDGRRVSLSVVRDVTERNLALRALQERERDQRLLIERSPDGILLYRDGRIVYANPRAALLLGVGEAWELAGAPVPPSLLEAAEDAIGEARFTRSDGTERIVETARLRVTFEGRETSVVIARDVTERRTLQARLAQADRLATVGTLGASVAHEVNNPLTYVMHYIERLERELKSMRELASDEAAASKIAQLEEGARTAAEGCLRVRDIVRDLKTFSRVEEGPTVPLDINRALRSAVQMASHQIHLKATLRVDYGAVPVVRANDGRLCQVFLNLLLNAVQAIEELPSADDHEVAVRSWSEHGVVYVAVTDTGAGIAGRHLARLFEPFFTTKADKVGSGLGLWISREIVHEYGGHIEVESEPGHGSTFTVVLPASDSLHEALSSAPPPSNVPLRAPRTPPRRILVVDDEPTLRDLLAEALSERAQVLTASSGREALELLEHDERFDAILCDLMMPGMTGVELYEWLEARLPELAARTVFMTGAAYTARTRDFLERIENACLSKPFRVRDVEQVLDRVLGRLVTTA